MKLENELLVSWPSAVTSRFSSMDSTGLSSSSSVSEPLSSGSSEMVMVWQHVSYRETPELQNRHIQVG
jgi:hypothetical protein